MWSSGSHGCLRRILSPSSRPIKDRPVAVAVTAKNLVVAKSRFDEIVARAGVDCVGPAVTKQDVVKR